jgi:hypothetical protein
VLIIGGSGIVGSQAARTLRRLHPDLPITIGGRDLSRAEAIAGEIGGATATRIDLERPDLGQPEGARYSAVVVFLRDQTLSSMRYALAKRLPYVSLSSGTFEIGPEVALFAHAPAAAPILLASHWLAGAATMPALAFAADYRSVEAIRIGALLDEADMGGPAAYADYERIVGATQSALIVENGEFRWISSRRPSRIESADGVEIEAHAYSPLDIVSLAAATAARSIRFDIAVGESASRRRGEPFSTEITIDLDGILASGRPGRSRHRIVHPAGQAPLTALGVTLAVERLLGLGEGGPVAPGLYFPEVLIDPVYFLRRMEAFGARVERC